MEWAGRTVMPWEHGSSKPKSDKEDVAGEIDGNAYAKMTRDGAGVEENEEKVAPNSSKEAEDELECYENYTAAHRAAKANAHVARAKRAFLEGRLLGCFSK
jgi:hypothetical protein